MWFKIGDFICSHGNWSGSVMKPWNFLLHVHFIIVLIIVLHGSWFLCSSKLVNFGTKSYIDVQISSLMFQHLSWRWVKFLLYLNYSHFVAFMCWERNYQTIKSHSINVSTETHFDMQWFFFQNLFKMSMPSHPRTMRGIKLQVGNTKCNYSTIVCTFWIKLYTQFVNLRL
jgi:hypothetical protein